MVMVHDVVSPPVAARYYAYAMLGAYQIVAQNNPQVPQLASFIKVFSAEKITVPAKNYDYRIAAIYCILETGKNMLPSGVSLQDDENLYVAQLQKNKISQPVIDQSIAVAQQVSAQIVNFSKADNYSKLSAKLRYTPKKGDAYWYPTPPAYLDAIEPNWKTIRPMVIDSAGQFKPAPPVKFSKDPESAFFKLAKEVMDVSKKPTQEQLHVAAFWDCNPFAVTTSGHMAIGYKKISPGGHWMNIAALAVKKLNLNFDQSIQTVALESLTLMDVFISCWDEKYHSNRIRPETYINKYIDINWKPFLQTPPFPEYTSGHSVVSSSSAEILTYLLGDFAYTDDTEIPYGVESRKFTSFNQAAAEAMISRLWGGIHFRDSIEEGGKEGREVAQNIIEKIKKAGIKPFRK
ncbi:MAG: phosphatase PAP2 family protein [Sphingobacteriaceae bacterium]|nr:MAG: phosphatase PAP2 family protein [Sphingobacteriaceae bacterium]